MEDKFKYLAKYSLFKKIKNKWFIIANIIVLIIVIGLVNIDSIVKFFGGDFNNELKINVIDNTNYYNDIKTGLEGVSAYLSNSKVTIKKVDNLKKQKQKLKDTDDILLVINKDENVFNAQFITDSYVDMTKYASIVSALNSVKEKIALQNSNIDKNELSKISKPINIKRSYVNQEKTEKEENSRNVLSVLSMVIVLPCFMLIVFLVQMIGAEINEEKQTRGMEIIIGNVSAKTHFFSKILASNLFVLLQGGLLVLYVLVGLLIRKTSMASSSLLVQNASSNFDFKMIFDTLTSGGVVNKLGYVIPLIIILLVLSFLAYSLLAGILASMTTNMENYQQLQTPLMVISVIGYYLIFLSTAFPGSLFIKIISCVPLISITLAPSLLLSGEISVNVIIIAIILIGALDYLLIKYGLKIYKVGILNYSESNLWKKMFKAVKEK